MDQDNYPAPLDDVERRAIECLLTGPELWKVGLRSQLVGCQAASRSRNIYGPTTYLLPSSNAPAEEGLPPAFPLECVVRHPSLSHSGNFALWTDAGKLHMLEAMSHGDEQWPSHDEPELFQFEALPLFVRRSNADA